MKKHIPNTITLCNLLCGVISVVISTTQFISLEWAVVFIFGGAIFDFFDGFSARLLKVSSSIGKELDSLADLITFGFAPAAITSGVIQHLLFGGTFADNLIQAKTLDYVLVFFPYIIVAFSALRLAKFNLDERQTHSFLGLPTPANAIFFASFALMSDITLEIFSPVVICAICLLFSLLLVSEIPMFSLKFQNFSWAENKTRFVFLGISLAVIAIFQFEAPAYIISIYILISVLQSVLSKRRAFKAQK